MDLHCLNPCCSRINCITLWAISIQYFYLSYPSFGFFFSWQFIHFTQFSGLLTYSCSNIFYCYPLIFHCIYRYLQRRQWHPTPVLLPGKPHGWRSLVGCSPWGHRELDTTEWLHFHFSLSCIGEGKGNPLQYSCLENPRDGGAWWAAIYGVAQSWTWLKRLSSSSNIPSSWLVTLSNYG